MARHMVRKSLPSSRSLSLPARWQWLINDNDLSWRNPTTEGERWYRRNHHLVRELVMTQSRSISEEVKELLKCSSRAGITTVIDFLSGRGEKKTPLASDSDESSHRAPPLSQGSIFRWFCRPKWWKMGKSGAFFTHLHTTWDSSHSSGTVPYRGGSSQESELASCTPDIPGENPFSMLPHSWQHCSGGLHI